MVDHLEYIHKQIGDYYILRWLGGGSFGNVYLAEQVRDHSQVALKLLHVRLTQSEDLKAFINEARTIRLKHPHIVSLLDFGISSENIPFLIMNYAAQGTLRDRYPKGTRVPPDMVRKYVQQVASALHYAHEQRLIHRDVKPENMLLSADGSVLLSDFGISSVAHSSQSTSINEGISGTIAYMAPEQIQGQTRAASDQYSFGIVVYEWLTGRRPFEGTTTEIAIQHLMNTPPPLHTFVPTLPAEVEQVVLQTLAKDPRQRFATMQAFATAFEQAWLPFAALSSPPPLNAGPQAPQQTGTMPGDKQTTHTNQPSLPTGQPTTSSWQAPPVIPATALPPAASLQNTHTTVPVQPTGNMVSPPSSNSPQATVLAGTQRTISRRALVASLVGVAAIGATAGGIALYTHISNSPTAFAFPPTSTTTHHPTPTHSATATKTLQETPTSSPGSPAAVSAFTYNGHMDAVRAVAWSRDGKYIASGAGSPNESGAVAKDQTVQTWDANTGKLIYTYQGHAVDLYGYGITAISWSPDSKRLAAGVNDQTVQVWNALDGSNVAAYPGYGSIADSVSWSLDNAHIASGYEDGKIKIWNAANGGLLQTYLWTAFNACYALAWSPDNSSLATATYDGIIQIWNAVSGGQPVTYGQTDNGGAEGLLSLSWSPDGKQVAAGGRNALVQIWNVADKRLVYTYKQHTTTIKAIRWSPDGMYIASGGADKLVQVWKVSNGTTVFTYRKHTGIVNSLAWSPDSKRIASASDDHTVQVWSFL